MGLCTFEVAHIFIVKIKFNKDNLFSQQEKGGLFIKIFVRGDNLGEPLRKGRNGSKFNTKMFQLTARETLVLRKYK